MRSTLLIWLLVVCTGLVRAQTGEAGHAIALDPVNGAVYVDEDSSATVVKQVGDSEVWRNQLSNSSKDAVLALAVNPSGDVYAAGTRNDGGFLAKLSPDGTRLAMVSLDAPARALVVDSSGAVYLAGDGFIRKFDTRLQPVYSVKPGGQVTSVAVNSHGEAYAAVVGEISGVWKLSADGSWLYQASVGPAVPSGLALDAVTNSVYVTGSTSSLDFPSTKAAQDRLSGVSDAFAAKIDDSGQMVWATYLGGSGADAGTAIAVGPDGILRVAGYTTSPDFPGSMTASRWNGYEDGFLAELDQAGNLIESRYVGTPGRDRILAIAIDPGNGAVHVAGWSDQGIHTLLRKRVATRPARSTSVRAASPLAMPASAFTLGTNSIIVPPGADSNSVLLAGTGAWTANTAASWLHLPVISGTGGATVVFNFDANPDVTRVGTITFNDGALTLTVKQAGASYVAVNSLTTLVSSGVTFPEGIAVDGSANIFIADAEVNVIYKWTASTQQVTTLISSGVREPNLLVVDGVGNLFFTDFIDNSVKKWTASTQQLTTLVSTGLSLPHGLTLDGAGNIYIVDTFHNAIKKWDASTLQVSTVVGTGLNLPHGVALDILGNVYIGDTNNSAVKVWSPTTQQVTTLVSSGLSLNESLAVDGSGNVYISDGNNHAVKKWSASTHKVTTLLSMGLTYPDAVVLDASGNLYIADPVGAAVRKLTFGFVGPVNITEPGVAGTDSLLPVLPSGTALSATSDQAWLTIGTIANDVVNFSFTANTTGASRTAHITVLGQQLTVTQTVGTQIMTANAGTTPQSAAINTAFASALAVTIKDSSNSPLPGINVTFTAPGSGASGKFSNNTATVTVATNSAGVATAAFTSNGTAGVNYTVTAKALGLTANFTLTNFVPMVQVTLQTVPSGLMYTVDNTMTYNTSQTLNWAMGSSHTIATVSPQAGLTGTQYVFTGWSDGGGLSHSITVPSTATTYTASFKTQYLLGTSVTPANSGTVVGAAFYDAGINASVMAVPSANYGFVSWTGNVASATNSNTTVAMTAPQSVTANFGISSAINICGAKANNFMADAGFVGGHCDSFAQLVSLAGVTNPAPQAVYQSKRTGSNGAGFSYTLQVTGQPALSAGQRYAVRLHFTDDVSTGANQRRFNVLINGTQVLTNFDIFGTAGGSLRAVVQSFTATANAQGRIVIQWTYGSVGNPLGNGVEITPPPAPTISGFTPTSGAAGTSVTITGVGFSQASGVTFNGVAATFAPNSDGQITATVPPGATTGPIAVTNAGGTAVSAANFTVTVAAPTSVAIDVGSTVAVGNFIADTYFNGGHTDTVAHTINASGVADAAPSQIYQTKRTGNNNGPFSYNIPSLPPNHAYSVKLHFGDDVSTAAGQRKFNVSINSTAVLSNFDIFSAAGAANKAVVRQFTATSDAQGRMMISVTPVVGNTLLNGIELIPQ